MTRRILLVATVLSVLLVGLLGQVGTAHAQPAPPGTPTASNVTHNSATISWSTVSGATSYQLLRRHPPTETGFSTRVDSLTGTTHTDTELSPSSQYVYRVKARNSSGLSGQSSFVSINTLASPVQATPVPTPAPSPAKVVNLNLTSTSFTIAATWDGATNANSYIVQWSTISGTFDGTNQATTSAPRYTIVGLSDGTVYYIRVISVRTNAANGDPSDVSQIATSSGGGSVYVFMTPAQGSRADIVGYTRNGHGSIDPTGFVNNVFSGSIENMVWDGSNKTILVVLSTTPRSPLDRLVIDGEGGNLYVCESASSARRFYLCVYDATSGAGEDVPWVVGQGRNIQLQFASAATPAPAPTLVPNITPFPPDNAPGDLPSAYGSRLVDSDVKLHADNKNPAGAAIADGHLYVYDSDDNKVYAYNVDTKENVLGRGFDVASDPKLGDDLVGFTYADGFFWFMSYQNDSSDPFDISYFIRYKVTPDISGTATAAACNVNAAETGIAKFTSYRVTGIGNQLLVRYWYDGEYYWKRWHTNTDPCPTQTTLRTEAVDGSKVSTGTDDTIISGTDGLAVDLANDVIWVEGDTVHGPTTGLFDSEGAEAFNYGSFSTGGVSNSVRKTVYDIWATDEQSEPYAFVYADDILYMIQENASGSTYTARAYNADIDQAYSAVSAFAQSPPTLSGLEVERSYTQGDANLIDVRLTWDHSSYVEDGHTIMEYRLTSPVTGRIGPVRLNPYPTEHIIKGLPRENYNLTLEARYHWYNTQDPSDPNSNHVLIKNPPNNGACAAENTDEYTSTLGNDDSIDATADADTTQPRCAFYVNPGESRYSQWVGVQINIAGLLTAVPIPGDATTDATTDAVEDYDYDGLSSAIAELFLVMGANPDDVAPLAKTIAILIWLLFASGIAIVVYYGTGFRTGSLYLATLLWLVIWAGLGPFVANVPIAMAYMPAAILMLAVGILVIKQAKL